MGLCAARSPTAQTLEAPDRKRRVKDKCGPEPNTGHLQYHARVREEHRGKHCVDCYANDHSSFYQLRCVGARQPDYKADAEKRGELLSNVGDGRDQAAV